MKESSGGGKFLSEILFEVFVYHLQLRYFQMSFKFFFFNSSDAARHEGSLVKLLYFSDKVLDGISHNGTLYCFFNTVYSTFSDRA